MPSPRYPTDRPSTQAIVDEVTYFVEQYKAVSCDIVQELLGDARFELLMRDKVRGKGAVDGMIYPWNVVD